MLRTLLIVLLVVCTLGTPASYGEDTADFRLIDIYAEKIAAQTIRVVFVLSGNCPPKIFAITENTPMVVCDFPDTKIGKGIDYPIEYDGDILKRIRLGIHNKPIRKTRVVLDLAGDQDYSLDQIFFEKSNHYVLTVRVNQ